MLWACPNSGPAPLGLAQEGAGSLWLGLSEERLLLVRPPPGGAAADPPGRQGALLELGLPLPPDPVRCRARFHRRSKVTMATAGGAEHAFCVRGAHPPVSTWRPLQVLTVTMPLRA